MGKIESFDIETLWIDNIAYAYCVSISDGGVIHSYMTTVENIHKNECLKFLINKLNSKKVYYVHNLSFEAFVLLKGINDLGIKYRLISSNRIVYSMVVWLEGRKVVINCSYRLTLLPLNKLADLAMVESKGVFPYSILNEKFESVVASELSVTDFSSYNEYYKFIGAYSNSSLRVVLKEYCENDVFITRKSVVKYWDTIKSFGLNYNSRILTAAKLSITNFFMKKTCVKKKLDIKLDRVIRNAYYGGRTEVFGNPQDDEICLHYDWSGMYAQCMKEFVPGGAAHVSKKFVSFDVPGFYHIECVQHMLYPILPVKRDRLYFSNGRIEGWYWFEEIKLFIENGGRVLKVNKCVNFQFYGPFLKDFIEINDSIREKGGLYKQIGKNNNNTFYGRLGMNPVQTVESITNIEPKAYSNYVDINGIKMYYSEMEKSVSNVSISAAVTSKARIKLYKGFKQVTSVGGRLLYCDTDSIIAAFKKCEYMNVLDREYGEVIFDSSKYDTIISDAVFALPKTYAVKLYNGDESVKIKGFNVKPNFESFKTSFYNGDKIETMNAQWGKKTFSITRSDMIKTTNLNSLYKRRWSSCKKYTWPIKMLFTTKNK